MPKRKTRRIRDEKANPNILDLTGLTAHENHADTLRLVDATEMTAADLSEEFGFFPGIPGLTDKDSLPD